jgi:hypothetical protein
MKAKAKRVKEHPYNDVTAAWLRENENALEALRAMQADHTQAVRELAAEHAEAWLIICKSHKAPKAVVEQAERNYNIAKARV